jgi:hypothetical protein
MNIPKYTYMHIYRRLSREVVWYSDGDGDGGQGGA